MTRPTTLRIALLFAATLSFAACSGGGSGTDGGSSGADAGSTGRDAGGTSGGNGGSDGGSVTYCDGIQVSSGSNDVYLLMYPESQDVAASCGTLATDAGFATSGTLHVVGGIWDSYAYAQSGAINGLYPGGCDDVGVGNGPTGGSFTAPDAGMTVAAAVAAAKAAPDGGFTADVYGVVTFVASGWGGSNGGNFYVQDPVASGAPQPGSGVDIYFGSSLKNAPANAPNRGDVVLLTGLSWSPYKGINEFGYQATSTMTTLGQSALPPPVSATAAQLAPTSTSLDAYKGMRVADTTDNFTISATCPSDLQYTASGGG